MLTKSLSCPCGRWSFRVRVNANEQVALLTCEEGHSSFLLDSGDYWVGVIQDGRPPEKRCSCGARHWMVSLSYNFRPGTDVVDSILATGTCDACGKQRSIVSFDIDYEPTDQLVTVPLQPCSDPWVKPKRTSITGLWTPSDLDVVIRHAALIPDSRVFVERWRHRPERVHGAAISALPDSEHIVRVFLTNEEVTFPEVLKDPWKQLPLIQLTGPYSIRYTTGLGQMYYLEFAEQVPDGDTLRPQSAAFVHYANQIRSWLLKTFSSARGKNTADNPSEYERLKGAW